MVKEIIKKTYLGRQFCQIRDRNKKKKLAKNPISEYENRFLLKSCAFKENGSPEYLRLRIIVESHVIEKGLSHNNYRPGFGRQMVTDLYEHLSQYILYDDIDLFAFNNAVSLLIQYHKRNSEYGFDDSAYFSIEMVESWTEKRVGDFSATGVKTINAQEFKEKVEKFDFETFANLRSSVRVFDKPCKALDKEMLREVVEIAKCAPSACNRQSIRVHFVTDNSKLPMIEKLQRGSKGFLVNCSAVAIVCADFSLYEASEYKLPIFDAGLFTMNLCYALESKGIYSCILNGYFSNSDDIQLRELVRIGNTEEVISLVAIYNIDDDCSIKVPVSPRRRVDELCSIQ